ncbi:hypothetical protein VTI74DRAFT_3462 [Chaetomium olivicolor]
MSVVWVMDKAVEMDPILRDQQVRNILGLTGADRRGLSRLRVARAEARASVLAILVFPAGLGTVKLASGDGPRWASLAAFNEWKFSLDVAAEHRLVRETLKNWKLDDGSVTNSLS